jgi:hypothetical protein
MQNEKPGVIALPFDLFKYRNINGKKDTTKTYTIVEGTVLLPSGERAFCEAFLQNTQHFQPGMYVMNLELMVERETRRVGARVVSILPQRVQAQPKAA